MPIYDYLCTACDHRADILHGINDPGPRYCLSCGAEGAMRKQFAAPAIHFKGSGWAKKDRGGSSRTKATAKGTSDERGNDAKDSGSSDSSSSSSDTSSSPSSSSSSDTSSSPSPDKPKPSTSD